MISEKGDVANSMTYPLVFIPVSFVFFIFLSYAFFSGEEKSKVDEVILTCRNGKLRSCFCNLCLIFSFNVFLLLLFVLYLGLQCAKALGSVPMDVIWFGVRCYLIHIILVNIFAALAGMAVSFIKNEIKAFVVMIVVCCFFSQFFLESLYKLSGNNLELWHMMDLFGLTTRMYHAAADYDYIFSIESVDLQRILFWIFATATILICYLAPGRKRFFTICSGVIMVILFVLYMQPNGASYLNVNMVSDANDEEYNYYNAHTEQIGTLEHCESEENFKITKYVADIHVNRILSADVEVYIDQQELDAYVFSLRHEYEVISVEDEYGKKVSCRQEGDWITLHPEDSMKHSKFIFHYQGASKTFYSREGKVRMMQASLHHPSVPARVKYPAPLGRILPRNRKVPLENLGHTPLLCSGVFDSTSQAIRLPAYFAYLPFSGKRYLYLELEQNYGEQDTSLMLYNGSVQERPGYKAEYDIVIDSSLKVYSNLKETEANHFHGISDGATLMANTFLEEEEISGVRVVHSKADPGYFPKVEPDYDAREEWRSFIAENGLQGKTIFALGVVHGREDNYRYFGEDHLVLISPCTKKYQTYLKTGKYPYFEDLTEEKMLLGL